MNEDGLLACPFCGSAEVSHSVGSKGDGSEWPYVECESCASATEPDVWNRRSDASLADAQAEIARLRGALEEINRITFDDDANRIAHLALNP